MTSGTQEAELTIAALLDGYRQGRFSVCHIVEHSLRCIERVDRHGPTLNAMIEIDDSALEYATDLDCEVASKAALRPLHGVPLVIKDNINVAGLATTGGCAALKGLRPSQDAAVVTRLKEAGAVILGKSSMSEFAWGTCDTENSVIRGFTRNPYHLDYASGGSSGGTGVAVAAGFCVAGLGTDTGCSVRSPSSINCIVGLRPTHGLIGMEGVIPMNADWDTVGPMARTVNDLAVVLDVISGEAGVEAPGNYAQALNGGSLSKARVGVVRQLAEPSDSDDDVLQLFDNAVADFKAAGATVIDPVVTDVFTLKFNPLDWFLRFRFDLDRFLEQMGDRAPMRSLEEVLQSGMVLSRYDDMLRSSLEWPYRPEHHPRLEQMRDIRDRYRKAFLELMSHHSLDGLIFPTFRFPPVLNGSVDGGFDAPIGSNNNFASLTGFPAISIPMGFVQLGLPIGLQLMCRPRSEARLLQIAYGYEQCTRHRRPPRIGLDTLTIAASNS